MVNIRWSYIVPGKSDAECCLLSAIFLFYFNFISKKLLLPVNFESKVVMNSQEEKRALLVFNHHLAVKASYTNKSFH